MNTPIVIVLALTLLAFLAHMSGGLLQSLTVDPKKVAGPDHDPEALATIDRNWVQSMCAFQLVSVDLLVISAVLYLLAFTTILTPAREIAFGVAGVYFLWGCSWLMQLFALKRSPKDFLLLGHWVFWFVCAILVYWGALSL